MESIISLLASNVGLAKKPMKRLKKFKRNMKLSVGRSRTNTRVAVRVENQFNIICWMIFQRNLLQLLDSMQLESKKVCVVLEHGC
jgi:hypothetical protein